MGRWEPNARGRLVRAALDLFTEQGYDNTTVAQIAERAGLTKTTFFRHFPDKREVMFAGQDVHNRLLADTVAAAPDSATPLEMVASTLDALAGSFGPDQREFGPPLRAVIATNGELIERSTFKRASLVTTLTEALRKRDVPDATASVAAQLGILAFDRAFGRWIEPTEERTFVELARQELDELLAATATL